MGASISAMLAAENKNVAGIIMLSPTLLYDNEETKNALVLAIGLRQRRSRLPARGDRLLPHPRQDGLLDRKPPYGLKDERLQPPR